MFKRLVHNRVFFSQGVLFALLLLRDVGIVSLPGYFYLGIALVIPLILNANEIIAYSVGFAMMGTGIQVTYIIASCLLAFLWKRNFKLNKNQIIISFVIIMYESLHVAFSPQDSLIELFRYAIIYIYIFVAMFDKYNDGEIVDITKAYINATVFVCIDVLMQTLVLMNVSLVEYLNMSMRLGYSDQLQQAIRFSADPNLLAQSCTISMVLIIVLIKKNFSDSFTKVSVVLLLLFGLMTLSKTFLLSLIVVFCCLLLPSSQNRGFTKGFKSFVCATLCILIAFIVVYNVYPSYIENITARFDTTDLTTGRTRIAKKYVEFFLEQPLAMMFGVGLQNLGIKSGCIASPHSAIIECIASFGILGTAFLYVFIFKAILNNRHNRKMILLRYMPLIITVILIQSTQFFRMRDRILTLIVIIIISGLKYNRCRKEGIDEADFDGRRNSIIKFRRS